MSVHGGCHCGGVKFELSEPPSKLAECNCTFCFKSGARWAYYRPEQVTWLTGKESMASYARDGGMIDHRHCAKCGMRVVSDSPTWVDYQPHPTERTYGINARLIDDFDISDLPIDHLDGRNLW